MTKPIFLLAIAIALSGCALQGSKPSAPATQPAVATTNPVEAPVIVTIDRFGQFYSNGMTVGDLPVFQKDFVGSRRVVLVPEAWPTLTQMLEARDRFRAAGMDVSIAGASGE